MKKTSDLPELNREEIPSRLEKIIKRDPDNGPKQVALFAARCGLRVLPLLAKEDGSGFRFWEEPRRHLVACWRALMISLCFAAGREVSYDAARASRAAAAARAAADDARADAAARAADTARAAAARAADARAAYADAARAARAAATRAADYAARAAYADAAVISSIKTDLSRLEAKDGLALTDLLWSIDSLSAENPLEEQTEAFFKACQTLGLDRIADSYQALLEGGGAAIRVADQDFEAWDDLWEEVQQYPDAPPEPELLYLFAPGGYLAESISDRDYLNRTWAVKALARWLGDKDQHQHITLGLFGNWGAGKSTFLHLLKTELCGQTAVTEDEAAKAMQALDNPAKEDALDKETSDKIKIIWGTFNAWEYERSDNIQAGLAQEVVAALRRDLTAFQTLVLTLQYAWAQYRSSWLWSLIILLVLVPLVVWGSGSLLEKAGWLGKDNLWLLGILPAELLAIWKLYPSFRTIFAHPLASDFNTYLRLPDFGKYLGAIPVLRKQIATLIRLRLRLTCPSLYRTACDQGLWSGVHWLVWGLTFCWKSLLLLLDGLIHLRFDFWWSVCQPEGKESAAECHGQRLVFVVDDLDRCSPEGIVKTLEAVRLLMDLDNVVVILAIDSRIAMASLALHYNSLSEHHSADPLGIARDYLGKIVHGSLVLQPPTENTVDAYLEEHLWGKDDSEPEPTTQAQSEALSEQSIDLDTKLDDLDTKLDDPKSEGQESPVLEPEPLEPEPLKSKPLEPKPLPVKEVRLTGLSRAQKDAYKDWVQGFGFRNPRQIKRLNNAYTLIRLTYSQAWSQQSFGIQPLGSLLPEQTAEDDAQPEFHRLVMLMWLEYLQELPSHEREPFERLLAEKENAEKAEADVEKFQMHIPHWNRVKERFPNLQTRHTLYFQVRCFVLPAINPVDVSVNDSEAGVRDSDAKPPLQGE